MSMDGWIGSHEVSLKSFENNLLIKRNMTDMNLRIGWRPFGSVCSLKHCSFSCGKSLQMLVQIQVNPEESLNHTQLRK
jgi:hypothetical protein